MTLALAHVGTLIAIALLAGFCLAVYLVATHRVLEGFVVALITLIAAVALYG